MIYTAALPSTLAPLKETDIAVATATYSFVRSFGFVWGVTMGGIVFNSQINVHLGLISDEGIRESLENGKAYAFVAGSSGLRAIADPKSLLEVIQVYAKSLKVVWLVVIAIGLLAFVLVPLQKLLKLKKENNTKFGIKKQKKKIEKSLV